MSHELICSWLGLPPGSWPPDHYALLGLEVGEGDVQKIEEHVHERLMKVRQYQLSHPDQATEAMKILSTCGPMKERVSSGSISVGWASHSMTPIRRERRRHLPKWIA